MKNRSLFFYFYNWFSFYIYWYICFWGAVNDSFYIGPLIGFGFILIHLLLIKNIWIEIKCIVVCTLLGYCFDFILLNFSIIEYKGQWLMPTVGFGFLPPIWILILWAGLGTLIFHSLKWLDGMKFFTTVLLGCIFFPWMYFSGDYYGAIIINNSIQNYLIISILGGLILSSILFIANKIKIV